MFGSKTILGHNSFFKPSQNFEFPKYSIYLILLLLDI
jgi:hypothetical protein